MAPCSSMTFALVSTASWLGVVQGGRFLAPLMVATGAMEEEMLAELSGEVLSTEIANHLAEIESFLSPMVESLPKDEEGRLNHEVVRYALHRYFTSRYSWVIRGLHSDGKINATASSAPSSLSFDEVPKLPMILQTFMENFHKGQGLNLRELTIVAAALEEVARQDAVQLLGASYDVLELNKTITLNGTEAEKVLVIFMVFFNDAHNIKEWSATQIRRVLVGNPEGVKRTTVYEKVHPFLEDLRAKVDLENNVNSNESMEFDHASKIASAFGRKYGAYNNGVCHGLKHALLGMEGRKPGRVRLSDFYNASRYGGVWNFRENIEYLRALNAIDESNASNPHVIVPNYITAMPQCLQASALYDVCCPNECEGLMGTIESALKVSHGNTDQITSIVSELPSDTVEASPDAPRIIEGLLLQRLEDIADQHGGTVPIHGRLFSQWMHHAFPRECPYPKEGATFGQLSPDEWLARGHETLATDEQMDKHIQADFTCPLSGDGGDGCTDALPWAHSEQLLTSADPKIPFVSRQTSFSLKMPTNKGVESLVFVVVVALVLYYSLAGRMLCKARGVKDVEHTYLVKNI